MMIGNRGSVFRLLAWQWKAVVVFLVFSAAISVLHYWVYPPARIPALPLAVVGGALGIFVSFRTNSAYARWWEGRQLWGRLVNASRHLCSQSLSYFPPDGDGRALAVGLVRRHIGYVHSLRAALRVQDVLKDADVVAHLGTDEVARLLAAKESNVNHAIFHTMVEDIGRAHRAGFIDTNQQLAFDETLRIIIDVQGGCERIKKTPLPPGYAFIASRLIYAFSLLFPLATIHELGLWVVPVNVLVCLAFTLISEAGRVLEDPFTMFWNGLPLTALSKTIEANLRQRLGDKDIPAIPQPTAQGILM